jgi:hypothetical protein
MDKEEVAAMIDAKIKSHEIRIGLISGIVGILCFGGIIAALLFLYYLVAQ